MPRPNAASEEILNFRFWNKAVVDFEMGGFEIFQLDSPFFWGGFYAGFYYTCARIFVICDRFSKFMLGFFSFMIGFQNLRSNYHLPPNYK